MGPNARFLFLARVWLSRVEGLTLPDLKTFSKATVFCGAGEKKNRQIDQHNRIESPEADPREYSQLIFDGRAKAVQ